MKNKKFCFCLLPVAAVVSLIGCGDDNGNGPSKEPSGEQTSSRVESVYELGKCNEDREGQTVLVEDDNVYYLCTAGKWHPVADGPSSNDEKIDDESSSSEDEGSSSTSEEKKSSSSSLVEGEKSSSSSAKSSSSSEKYPYVGNSSSSVMSSSSSVKSSSSSVMSSSSRVVRSSSSIVVLPASSADKSGFSYDGVFYEKKDASYFDERNEVLLDQRDGHAYRTVKIGDLRWMAQNLNYAYLHKVIENAGEAHDTTSFCYLSDPENCDKYGRLYEWGGAMDFAGEFSNSAKGCTWGKLCNFDDMPRGVCPKGWHIPSLVEFKRLINEIYDEFGYNHAESVKIDSSTGVARKLKTTSGWVPEPQYNNPGPGTDDYGFSAIPAGIINMMNGFDSHGLGTTTVFLTSTLVTSDIDPKPYRNPQWFSYVFEVNSSESASIFYGPVVNAASVRCVQNPL